VCSTGDKSVGLSVAFSLLVSVSAKKPFRVDAYDGPTSDMQ
jgi:hypothetical protein